MGYLYTIEVIIDNGSFQTKEYKIKGLKHIFNKNRCEIYNNIDGVFMMVASFPSNKTIIKNIT